MALKNLMYYKDGDGNVKEVGARGCAVPPDGESWELIAVQNVDAQTGWIDLLEEPDGTPYSFSKILIECELTATSASNFTYRVFDEGWKNETLMYVYIGAENSKTQYIFLLADYSGGLDILEATEDGANDITSSRGIKANVKHKKVSKKITRVSLQSTISAGSSITIWGVRA